MLSGTLNGFHPISRATTNNSLSENSVLPVPMQLQDKPRTSLFPPRLLPLTTSYVNILEVPLCKKHIKVAGSVAGSPGNGLYWEGVHASGPTKSGGGSEPLW